MSGASQAVDALQAAASEAYASATTAGRFFAQRHSDLKQTTDLTDALRAMVDLIGAIEALHDATDAAIASLRATLAAQMEATGCPQVFGTHKIAHMARKQARVEVDHPSLVPKQYLREVPDKKLLLEAMKDGQEVPGATLIRPNEMSLVLRSRKEPT